MAETQEKIVTESNIEKLFQMVSGAAMNPRRFVKKELPDTVTVTVRPENMEILDVIAARTGASRASVARLVLEAGLIEAAYGCGFTVDEDGRIPEDQKGNWDLTPKVFGFGFPSAEEKE